MLIAIPAFRLSSKVIINKGRAWSVFDEVILWALSRRPLSIATLAREANLPRQLVVASLARMMRFRLVELEVSARDALFRASAYGMETVEGGRSMPFFPKQETRRVSCVIERATGGFFPTGQVRIGSLHALNGDPDNDKRIVTVAGGGPSMSHEANLARLSEVAARGWEEQLAHIDGRTASLHSEFMLIRVVDGVPRNLPDAASTTLREIVAAAVALPTGTTQVAIGYGGTADEPDPAPVNHACHFEDRDLIIGGSEQLTCLQELLATACSRLIIHSTFLDHVRFRALAPDLRTACARGVSIDLLWGAADVDGEQETKNGAEAVRIANIVREDRDLARHFRIHMRSTGSHAKLLLADTPDGQWIAAVGSCNWLSSPFRAVELTAVLRDPHVVADLTTALQRLVGRLGISDDLATEMTFVTRDLRRNEPSDGTARITLVVGDRHDEAMRTATGEAARRVLVGCHRLGSTARPGVVLQAEAAVERANIDVALLYTRATGPLKNRHTKKLAEEAENNGVRLIRTGDIPLHGKFVLWDDDDVIVTSLNWASAASDADLPLGDIGVQIHSPGLANLADRRLKEIYPHVAVDKASNDRTAGG